MEFSALAILYLPVEGVVQEYDKGSTKTAKQNHAHIFTAPTVA